MTISTLAIIGVAGDKSLAEHGAHCVTHLTDCCQTVQRVRQGSQTSGVQGSRAPAAPATLTLPDKIRLLFCHCYRPNVTVTLMTPNDAPHTFVAVTLRYLSNLIRENIVSTIIFHICQCLHRTYIQNKGVVIKCSSSSVCMSRSFCFSF